MRDLANHRSMLSPPNSTTIDMNCTMLRLTLSATVSFKSSPFVPSEPNEFHFPTASRKGRKMEQFL